MLEWVVEFVSDVGVDKCVVVYGVYLLAVCDVGEVLGVEIVL